MRTLQDSLPLIVTPDDDPTERWHVSQGGLILPGGKRAFTGIDLFAGVGGMSLGFIEAGCEVVAAVDNWPLAALTYMTNLGTYPCTFHFVDESDREAMEKEIAKQFRLDKRGIKKGGIVEVATSGSAWIADNPHVRGVGHFWLGDIRKISGGEILKAVGLAKGEVGCVFGGPPCQGFSYANSKRGPDDPRNNLVFEFARLVLEINPKTMVMENVPGMAKMTMPNGVGVLDQLCRILEDGGWGSYEAIHRSLAGKPGRRAAMRSKPQEKSQRPSRRRRRQASSRACPTCGKGLAGRRNKKYCRAACKQQAYRTRRVTDSVEG